MPTTDQKYILQLQMISLRQNNEINKIYTLLFGVSITYSHFYLSEKKKLGINGIVQHVRVEDVFT